MRLDAVRTPSEGSARLIRRLPAKDSRSSIQTRTAPLLRSRRPTHEEPLLLSIAGYQVLAYAGKTGVRVAAWKHPTRVDGEVFVEYEIEETRPYLAVQRFQTVQDLEDALLHILRPN